MKLLDLKVTDFLIWGNQDKHTLGKNLHVILRLNTANYFHIMDLLTLEIHKIGSKSSFYATDVNVHLAKMVTTKWNYNVSKDRPIFLKDIKPRELYVEKIDPLSAKLFMVFRNGSETLGVIDFKNLSYQLIDHNSGFSKKEVYPATLKHPIVFRVQDREITWSPSCV